MTAPSLPVTYTDVFQIMRAQPEMQSILPEQIEQAAGEAEAEINGHLAKLYKLPLTVAVPLLTTVATEMAVYKIFASKSFSAPPRPVEAAWVERYRSAIAILLKLATGEMVLVGVDGAVVPPLANIASAWSSKMQYTPTFGEGADQGFFVDRSKLEDEAARRGF